MPSSINITASYMNCAHDLAELTAKFVDRTRGVNFDTVVGTGLSGALVVPALARELDKNWLLVRKADDGTHSSYPAEGRLGERWMFVDDLISSGATRRRVMAVVADLAQEHKHRTQIVGQYLYQWYEPYAAYGSSEFPKARKRDAAGRFA